MGGCIGMNLAHRRPDLLSTLVMADSPVMPVGDALRPLVDSILAGCKGPSYQQTAATFVSSFMFNENSDPAFRDEVVPGMARAPQRLMHTAIASTFAEENLPPGLIPVQSLFIRAATHAASPEEISFRYGLPVAEVNAAHFLQFEQPTEANRIVRRFLEELP